MIRLPSYVPLAVGIWLVPVMISLIVVPLPPGLAWLAPSPYAATLTLQYLTHLEVNQACADYAAVSWQEVAASPHAASWFQALVREGPTATSRAYGLVGLYSLDSALVTAEIGSLPASLLDDTVRVLVGDTVGWRWDDSSTSLRRFAGFATLKRHADALARDQRGRPEC